MTRAGIFSVMLVAPVALLAMPVGASPIFSGILAWGDLGSSWSGDFGLDENTSFTVTNGVLEIVGVNSTVAVDPDGSTASVLLDGVNQATLASTQLTPYKVLCPLPPMFVVYEPPSTRHIIYGYMVCYGEIGPAVHPFLDIDRQFEVCMGHAPFYQHQVIYHQIDDNQTSPHVGGPWGASYFVTGEENPYLAGRVIVTISENDDDLDPNTGYITRTVATGGTWHC
jgi:hypothetical protein